MDALAQAEKRADSSVQLGVELETKTLELAQVSDELQRVKKAVHVRRVLFVHCPYAVSLCFFLLSVVQLLQLFVCGLSVLFVVLP